MTRFDRITTDPNVMQGQPCIRGTRIPVRRVLLLLTQYASRDELRADYPQLEDADIDQALGYAGSIEWASEIKDSGEQPSPAKEPEHLAEADGWRQRLFKAVWGDLWKRQLIFAVLVSLGLGAVFGVAHHYLFFRPSITTMGIWIYDAPAMRAIVVGFTAFACVGLLASILLLFRGENSVALHLWVWWLWVCVPPLWFYVEYFFLYPYWGSSDADALASLKYGQRIAAALWASGAVIAFARVYEDFKSNGAEP